MYTCGITPYDSAHLGHAAVYVTYDVLQRRLRDLGHRTLCVRNITDVDDDILRKARELGVHYLDLAAGEIARFDADMEALGLLRAYSEPRATSAIPDILGFIGMVLDTGHAYRAGGGVYFDVSSSPALRPGEPSRARRDDRAGRRPAAVAPKTRSRTTRSTSSSGSPRPRESPPGSRSGAPGARDGTSSARRSPFASSARTIDLHGGGSDLIFPHHECESAQSEAATGSLFVRHWMHVGMVRLGGEKMSKSLGNLVFVHKLLGGRPRPGRDPAGSVSPALSLRLGVEGLDARGGRGPGSSAGGRPARARAASTLGAGQARRRPRHAGSHRGDRRGGRRGPRDEPGGPPARSRARLHERSSPFGRLGLSHRGRRPPARGAVRMPTEITVFLPDGSARSVPAGTTIADLARSIGRRLAAAAVAAELDGALVDLSETLLEGAKVRIITADSDEGRGVLRHSTAHVLAQAVLRLWPGARYAIGPAIADGFYYDFELPDGARFSDEDLGRIDAEMRAIVAEAQPFVREEHTISEGLEIFADQPYKREIIEGVAEAAVGLDEELAAEAGGSPGAVSAYRNGPGFVDLCRGPHVPSTDRLGHFKLTRVAGAYWRGDEHRQQLQRIYGTAWESDEALEAHLHRLEEAERRDHRRLGAELDLFSFPPELGSGLAVFHPKGGLVRKVMEDYSRAPPRAGRLRVRQHAPHHQVGAVRDLRAPATGSPRACSRRWSSTRVSSTT